jgi:hypothetical protein
MIRLTMIATPLSGSHPLRRAQRDATEWEFGHRKLRSDFRWWEIRLRVKHKARRHWRVALTIPIAGPSDDRLFQFELAFSL